MADSVAKRGRPKLRRPPKMSCVQKQNRDIDSYHGFRSDNNTQWHINVDSYRGLPHLKKSTVVLPKDAKWMTIRGIDLSQEDRLRIIRGEWLSDNIINAAQEILSEEHYIDGLQNILCAEMNHHNGGAYIIDWDDCKENMDVKRELILHRIRLKQHLKNARKRLSIPLFLFQKKDIKRDITRTERRLESNLSKQISLNLYFFEILGLQPLDNDKSFVQILLDKNSKYNHWICLSNMRTDDYKTVRIYDSDLSRINNSIENYSRHLLTTIKRLFCGQKGITIELALVTQCDDRCSGGVYAIAFAHALCVGLDPSDILFTSDAMVMRNHLSRCLEDQHLRLFPLAIDYKLAIYDISLPNKQKHKNNSKN